MKTEELIKDIKKRIDELPKRKLGINEQEFVQRYLGSKKRVLGAKTGDLVRIAKEVTNQYCSICSSVENFSRSLPRAKPRSRRLALYEATLSVTTGAKSKGSKNNYGDANYHVDELIKLLDQLFAADTFEEYVGGGEIFTLLKPEVRSKISFDQLEKWLASAKGWVEVDVICQSSYTGAEVLGRWTEWEKMIKKFRKSEIISLRRASLVLQNPPVRKTNEPKLRKLASETIEELKHEKDGLITKAVSWLLRSLTDLDKQEVKSYLIGNEPTLPRIAFRETMKL